MLTRRGVAWRAPELRREEPAGEPRPPRPIAVVPAVLEQRQPRLVVWRPSSFRLEAPAAPTEILPRAILVSGARPAQPAAAPLPLQLPQAAIVQEPDRAPPASLVVIAAPRRPETFSRVSVTTLREEPAAPAEFRPKPALVAAAVAPRQTTARAATTTAPREETAAPAERVPPSLVVQARPTSPPLPPRPPAQATREEAAAPERVPALTIVRAESRATSANPVSVVAPPRAQEEAPPLRSTLVVLALDLGERVRRIFRAWIGRTPVEVPPGSIVGRRATGTAERISGTAGTATRISGTSPGATNIRGAADNG